MPLTATARWPWVRLRKLAHLVSSGRGADRRLAHLDSMLTASLAVISFDPVEFSTRSDRCVRYRNFGTCF